MAAGGPGNGSRPARGVEAALAPDAGLFVLLQFLADPGEGVHAPVRLLLGDHQGRAEADCVGAAAENQESVTERAVDELVAQVGRCLSVAVDDIDADHEPDSPGPREMGRFLA